jgi:hypothetical protein
VWADLCLENTRLRGCSQVSPLSDLFCAACILSLLTLWGEASMVETEVRLH